LEIPVLSFRSGNSSRDRDVAKIVNRAKVRVEIFAAGRAKAYETLAQFNKIGEDKMFTDFGIEPPSLGVFIKRAPDELELSGEITFRIERKEG
jgi:hypothetical protein